MRKVFLFGFVLMVVCCAQLFGQAIIELDGGAKDQQQADDEALLSDEPFVTSTTTGETAMITETIGDFLADAANYVRSLPDDEKKKMEYQEEEEVTDPAKKESSQGVWKAMEISRNVFNNWVNFSKKPNLRHIYYHGVHGVAEEDEAFAESDPSVCADLVDWLFGQEQGKYYHSLVQQAGDGGKVVVMCQEDPKTGAKEYKAEANSCESYEVVGYHHGLSPVLIDVNFLKEPDLLAGPYWKKNRKGDIEPAALRSFNLDNKGAKNWEWVGPRTGLLVWSDKGPEIQPTGYNLFGNVTWDQQWIDGYEPLAALDDDKNGQLTEAELTNLFVWLDLNSDAVAQAGEIKPVADHQITSIGVKPTRDSEGNAHLATGFIGKNGQQGHTWDWWSRQGAAQTDHKVVYAWKPMAKEAKIPGGMFVFTKDVAGQLHMMSFVPRKPQDPDSTSMIGFPMNVERHGQKLRWHSALHGQEVVTDAVIEDGKIIGVTRVFRKGSEPFRYTWVALPTAKETL